MADLASGFQGFTFNPPPLVLNGQSIGGGINFTASNAVSQVDQASQAYSFISNLNQGAYSFLGGTLSGVQNFASQNFSGIIEGLSNIGHLEAKAQNTAASNTCTGFLGCLFG